jgi:CubicO group peptidase (beta-lactamase class C family)
MRSPEDQIDEIARRTGFSGVIRIDRAGVIELANAYGFSDRAHEIANTMDTRFGIASGTKGFTALTIVSLIEDGALSLATTARSVLGGDLPLIDDAVTVEHLLAHRSGIGDYLDEDAIDDMTEYLPPIPVRELATTEDYLPILGGYETVFAPGERFAYNNGAFVVLAVIAERVGGESFHDLVRRLVCEPAGLADTAFLRSDELPGSAAVGYVANEGLRTNVFHLPVRGSGDGGIFTSAADVSSLWTAFLGGRIVSEGSVREMVRPRSDAPNEGLRYGLGIWLRSGDELELHGYDAGVSFRSTHDPATRTTTTVISNTGEGTWPIEELLDGQPGT